ncbi:MAG TPA: cupin domain-containing protein [Terriglobales bacterium]|nr:cupin domain-containing protein [Terriglobales bacterium]
MRKHLFFVLMLATAVALVQQAATSTNANHQVWEPGAVQWGAAPDILPPGSQLAVLEGDPTQPGEFTMRLKMPDGYKIPPHWHPRMEHVTVVSGLFKVGMGDKFDEAAMAPMAPGAFGWIKPHTHHFAMAKGETVIQLHGNGPWELVYVNPGDDPRQQKK